MKLRPILLLSLCGLVLCGCARRLDPFTGTDGVRANINGDKYVMLSLALREPYAVCQCQETSFSMQASLIHVNRGMERYQKEIMSGYTLSISVESNTALQTGNRYSLGSGSGGGAKLKSNSADGEENVVSLLGWISFTSLSPTVEARFELESPGYEVRHGLLRMKR